jgi:hypothetical protein
VIWTSGQSFTLGSRTNPYDPQNIISLIGEIMTSPKDIDYMITAAENIGIEINATQALTLLNALPKPEPTIPDITDAMIERHKALFAAAHEADDCHQPLECDPRDIIVLETEMRHFEVAMQASQPADDVVELVARAVAYVIAKRHNDGHEPSPASVDDWTNDQRREEARAAIATLSQLSQDVEAMREVVDCDNCGFTHLEGPCPGDELLTPTPKETGR